MSTKPQIAQMNTDFKTNIYRRFTQIAIYLVLGFALRFLHNKVGAAFCFGGVHASILTCWTLSTRKI